MKILFVGWYPNPVDPYKNCFFQNLVHRVADKGNDCVVISPVSILKYRGRINEIPEKDYELAPNGARVEVYYPRVLSASAFQFGKYNTSRLTEKFFQSGVERMAKKIDVDSFDAVYGHFFLCGGLAAIKIARKYGKPCFVAYGECDYYSQIKKPYGELTCEDIRGLTGIVSVSSSNTKELVSRPVFNGVPIKTIPNAVDLNVFKPMDSAECKKAMGFPSDRAIVGFVGGFIERKGDKRLLEACESNNELYLAFAGKGAIPPSGENVIFAEPVERAKMPVFLNAIDIFVLPTLNEGCCNAILEAMACGKPVVSSDLDFNDGIVEQGRGLRVDPMNSKSIAAAVMKLIDNPGLRCELAAESFEFSKSLDIDVRADKILDFIKECMEDSSCIER